jgi:hypothetical protein
MFGVLALTTMAIFVGCGDDDDSDDGGDTGGSAGKGGTGGKGGSGGSSAGTAGKGGTGGTAGKGGTGGEAGGLGEGGTPTGTGGGAGAGSGYDYEAACTPQCEENAACLESGAGGGGGMDGVGGGAGEPYDVEGCIAGCAAQAEDGCEPEYQDLLDCKGAEETTWECAPDVSGLALPMGCDDELGAYGICRAG